MPDENTPPPPYRSPLASAAAVPIPVRQMVLGSLVDIVGILAVSGLILAGKLNTDLGVPVLVAIIAGRLRPAYGSGVVSILPLLIIPFLDKIAYYRPPTT